MEKAIDRLRVILRHFLPSSNSSSSLDGAHSSVPTWLCVVGDHAAHHRTYIFSDDIVVVAAFRKDTYADDVLTPVLKALIEKTNLNPSEMGDIVVGTVIAPGSQRASKCRMAAFYAGFSETVHVGTVNRKCSSGLQAVADVAAAIRA